MRDRHPAAGHLPSCRHPTGWQPPGEGASPGRKMPDVQRPDGPERKPSFLFPPLSVSWRWRVSRVSAVRASSASAAAPSLTLTWRVLSRRGVAARHLPSPPLGPGLASAPGCLFRGGRAAWCRLWPFVREDEPGTCSAGCGFACGCRARLCHRAVLVRGRPPCSAAAAGGWEGGQVRSCASPPSPVGPAGGWRHLSEATRVARASCRLTSDAGTFCCEPGTGPGASPRGPLI